MGWGPTLGGLEEFCMVCDVDKSHQGINRLGAHVSKRESAPSWGLLVFSGCG